MKSAIVATIFLACIAGSLAVKCYTCIGCAQYDYTKPSGELLDCGSGFTKCTKTDADVLGIKVTTRACSTDACVEGNFGGVQTYCCSGDECNSASGLSTSLIAALFTAVLAYFIH